MVLGGCGMVLGGWGWLGEAVDVLGGYGMVLGGCGRFGELWDGFDPAPRCLHTAASQQLILGQGGVISPLDLRQRQMVVNGLSWLKVYFC